jgi:hypothetical protein
LASVAVGTLLLTAFVSSQVAAPAAGSQATDQEPPAASGNGQRLLTSADFHYVGTSRLFGDTRGLAYRPSTKTWFTVKKGGMPPFPLVEFTFIPDHAAVVVKDWGPIDPGDRLQMARYHGSAKMPGLLWDEERKGLWLTFGNWYNAAHANQPFMAFLRLPSFELEGPWATAGIPHSERCKGWLQFAPPRLRAITGQEFVGGAPRSNTSQLQSAGPGLVTLDRPTTLAQTLHGHDLIYWPYLTKKVQIGPRRYIFGYSLFPRWSEDSNCTYISGNDDVGNRNRPANYERNVFSGFPNGKPQWMWCDAVDHGIWIETPTRHGLLYTGFVGLGYMWYGNGKAHADLDSKYEPGTPCIDRQAAENRGGHAEFRAPRFYLFDTEPVLKAARAGAPMQLAPTEFGDLRRLGGLVPVDVREVPHTGQFYFDGSRLSGLSGVGTGAAVVHAWKIR